MFVAVVLVVPEAKERKIEIEARKRKVMVFMREDK